MRFYCSEVFLAMILIDHVEENGIAMIYTVEQTVSDFHRLKMSLPVKYNNSIRPQDYLNPIGHLPAVRGIRKHCS